MADDSLKKAKETIAELNKVGKVLKDLEGGTYKNLGEALEGVGKSAKDALDDINSFVKKYKDISEIKTIPPELEKRSHAILKDATDYLGMSKKTTEEQAKAEDILKRITTETEKLNKDMKDFDETSKDAYSRWSKMGSAVSGVGGTIGNILSGNIKGAVSSTEGLGETMSMASTGPALIAVAIIAAIKKLFDFVRAVDRFKKEANQKFADIKGPDFGAMTDKFKQFNDAVFDVVENLKTGLDPKEVQAFFESMYATGKRVQDLGRDMLGYRKYVTIAREAQLTFGLSLSATGQAMTEMMIDMGMSLKRVETAFAYMTQEAKDAGISSDRFWNAIQNATVGMSLYGDFVKAAAKSTAEFVKNQAVGAKEGADTAAEFMQSFQKMSLEQKMFYVQMLGGKGSKDLFEKRSAELKEALDDVTVKIKTTMDAPEFEGKQEEIANLQRKQNAIMMRKDMADAAAMGDLVAQANFLAETAGDAASTFPKVIERMLHAPMSSFFKSSRSNQLAVLNKLASQLGISEKAVMAAIGTGVSMEEGFITQVNAIKKNDKDLISLKKVMKIDDKKQRETELKNLGINGDTLAFLSSLDSKDKDLNDVLEDMKNNDIQSAKDATPPMDKLNDRMYSFSMESKKSDDENMKQAKKDIKDTSDAIVTLTTPIDKVGSIISSQAQYWASSSMFLSSIANATIWIAKNLPFNKGYRDPMTQSLDKLQDDLAKRGKGFTKDQAGLTDLLERIKKIQEDASKAGVTTEDQKKDISDFGEAVNLLKGTNEDLSEAVGGVVKSNELVAKFAEMQKSVPYDPSSSLADQVEKYAPQMAAQYKAQGKDISAEDIEKYIFSAADDAFSKAFDEYRTPLMDFMDFIEDTRSSSGTNNAITNNIVMQGASALPDAGDQVIKLNHKQLRKLKQATY